MSNPISKLEDVIHDEGNFAASIAARLVRHIVTETDDVPALAAACRATIEVYAPDALNDLDHLAAIWLVVARHAKRILRAWPDRDDDYKSISRDVFAAIIAEKVS